MSDKQNPSTAETTPRYSARGAVPTSECGWWIADEKDRDPISGCGCREVAAGMNEADCERVVALLNADHDVKPDKQNFTSETTDARLADSCVSREWDIEQTAKKLTADTGQDEISPMSPAIHEALGDAYVMGWRDGDKDHAHYAPPLDETTLRRMLFLSHSCVAKYGDDGEMQCAACFIDFKRMPPREIEKALHQTFLVRMSEGKLPSTLVELAKLQGEVETLRTEKRASDTAFAKALEARTLLDEFMSGDPKADAAVDEFVRNRSKGKG